jgi:2-oxoglutarate dehydrogenase E1 component
VIFTPKSLLRHPKAISTVHDLTSGRIPGGAGRSGSARPGTHFEGAALFRKIYYDLLAAREERKADHIAIVRLEQLYPFSQSM